MNDEFITLRQAAAHTGVSYQTIRRLVISGRLPVYANELRRYPQLVRRSDLDAFTRVQQIEPGTRKAAAR